ncbi:MAG: hypothetical protein HY238_02120 [Acidobacteria bacterium]|nr:hypothetical protein [Acidobacteriota bacterium]
MLLRQRRIILASETACKAPFAIDPKLAPNRIIADVDLAPRNAQGLVEFSADLYILKPAKSNGTILFEVVNRGNKGLLTRFHLGAAPAQADPRTAAHFGDRFLLDQGFTLVWLGWQGDIPKGRGMRMEGPVAKGATGLVRYSFVPAQTISSTALAGRGHLPYPVSDETDPRITLTVRERAEGERRVLPRSAWRFVDRASIAMDAGFERAKIYEILYPSQDPWIAGLGPAGIRDLISYLKFDGLERHLKRAIGFGTSQSGRFLRTFLYGGFNQDEKGRQAYLDQVAAAVRTLAGNATCCRKTWRPWSRAALASGTR